MKQLSDFDYQLPEKLIASFPLPERSASRLLALHHGTLRHRLFTDLLDYLRPNDCLVFNNTRVIRARLYGQKSTGGQVECLIERILDSAHFLCHIKASKSPRTDSLIHIDNQTAFKILDRKAALYHCKLVSTQVKTVWQLMESFGEIPLPHYMKREAESADDERYQTVYAKTPGAVAAPTAGLHFDEAMLARLQAHGVSLAYVTLHVGAGTFQPVRVEDITAHTMHSEWYAITDTTVQQINKARANGGRVIAVGTTSLRTLESAGRTGQLNVEEAETNLFIYPGFEFKQVDALITNFHLPKSTLLMLVTAFGGYELVMKAYAEAVKEAYRFFSYGDAMWIEKQCNSN